MGFPILNQFIPMGAVFYGIFLSGHMRSIEYTQHYKSVYYVLFLQSCEFS